MDSTGEIFMIKRFLMVILLVSLTGVVSAQEDASLIPNELYFQSAMFGEWQVIDSENGILTLSGVSPRLQYTMTNPRLWSMSLDNAPFVQTWGTMTDIAPLEAILSFDVYNIRLLLSAPVYYATDDIIEYQAQVVDIINFLDETTKDIPLSFQMPSLTIQPTLDFTLALMDAASNRLDGTRNADCSALNEQYRIVEGSYAQTQTDYPWMDTPEQARERIRQREQIQLQLVILSQRISSNCFVPPPDQMQLEP